MIIWYGYLALRNDLFNQNIHTGYQKNIIENIYWVCILYVN